MKEISARASLSVFIISWQGQHLKAAAIAQEVGRVTQDIHIIFSDPNLETMPPTSYHAVRRPNNLFWEDKFKACLELCDDKPLLIIQADCSCEDWPKLVRHCMANLTTISAVGVWAPKVVGSIYPLETSRILRIPGKSLSIVALVDGLVFGLSPEVINRMRRIQFGNNPFGWGIVLLACAYCRTQQKSVIVDESIEVIHTVGSGYNRKKAKADRDKFYEQFQITEFTELKLLSSFVSLNKMKLGMSKPLQ